MINYQLCKEFPALSPYEIDEKTFHNVISLYSDVRALQIREKKSENKTTENKVIRRPAGDNWF